MSDNSELRTDAGLQRDAGTSDGGTSADAGDQEDAGDRNPKPCGPDEYPCGPYGYVVGSTVDNLRVFGWHDTNGDGTVLDETAQDITLKGYFENKSIKAVVVVASAEWCAPCNSMMPSLVDLYTTYQNEAGGSVAFLNVLVEDVRHQPADVKAMTRWAIKFGIAFDLAVDPGAALAPFYDINSFPYTMVIRASDMTVVSMNNAGNAKDIQTAVDAVLAGE